MGLVPAFVLSADRRTVLAVLAIAVSISYALVAGAAVSGLKDAQAAIAEDLLDTDLVAVDAADEAFDPGELGPSPDTALVRASPEGANARTYAAVRVGEDPVANASRAYAPGATGLEPGLVIRVAERNLTVERIETVPGADPTWVIVDDTVVDALGAPSSPRVHVAVFEDPDPGTQATLEDNGFEVRETPATLPFYAGGADHLVSAVRVTVLASAIAVGLMTSAFVRMELRAKRRSFATLRAFAGNTLVQRLVAGRGLVLLVAGHVVGVAATFGVIFLLRRADAAALALPLSYVGPAVAATMGGGLVGLVPAVRRASEPLEVAELAEETPASWLPRPLRLTLTDWRSVVPLAAAALILSASLGVVFGTVDMPGQIFGVDDANVITEQSSNNPLRGRASAFLGTHMAATEDFEASSPEIFAPTTIEGRPVMVRGVSWPNLVGMEDVRLVEGEAPDEPGEAAVGTRLARVTDAGPGDELLIPGAYTRSVLRVSVVGVVSAPGLLGDELLVPLETGQRLADLPPDAVNIIRYREAPEAAANRTAPLSLPRGLVVTELTVDPENPVPLQTTSVRADLVNFDDRPRSRQLTLRVDGEPIADAFVALGPKSTAAHTFSFRVPSTGSFRIDVNPTRTIETSEPAYRVQVPPATIVDEPLTVGLRTTDDEPASGVEVRLLGQTVTTGSEGQATLTPDRVGNHTIEAEGPEGSAVRSILVVQPGDLHRSHLLFRELSGPDETGTSGRWQGAAVVENVGGEAFDGMVQVQVDGNATNATTARVLPGGFERISFTLELEPGNHTISGEGARTLVTVPAPPTTGDGDGDGNQTNGDGDGDGDGDPGGDGGDGGTGDGGAGEDDGPPTVEELLERRRERVRQETAQVDPLQAFLGDTFENFNAAVTVVTLATVLHAGLVALVAVRRDVEEHAPNVGAMASMGATRGDLRKRAVWEFALVGGVAAALGTAVGLGIVHLAASQAWIGGFGHALVPRSSPGFALRVAGVAVITIVVAAAFAVENVRGRTVYELLIEGPARGQRPPLDAFIGEEP